MSTTSNIFKPTSRILIASKSFPADDFICLGKQLAYIVNFLRNLFPEHLWYGADVDGVGAKMMNSPLRGIHPILIGTDSEFIEYCLEVDQFLSGVFICVDCACRGADLRNVEVETEDEGYRPINSPGILLEIRAFDTSYFEVYLKDDAISDKIFGYFKFSILRDL